MNRVFFVSRLAILALLITLSFKPVMTRSIDTAGKGWAVIVDNSQSMKVKDPVERLVQAGQVAKTIAGELDDPQLFKVSQRVEPMTVDEVETLKSEGRGTDLAAAVTAPFENHPFQGAVLVTDGRNVGPGDPVSAAASIGKPLLLVGVGDKSLFKDVAVKSVQNPPFAFKNIQTSLAATVSIVGFQGKSITVKLKEGGRILGLQTIEVGGNDVETSVSFSWTPTSLGSKLLSVEASEYEGEVSVINNRKEVSMDVGRDRFRVLYICGVPGPEYGFLRYQFKSDPAVELVTFVILRNAGNVVTVPETELSLIPFPTQDVLIQQLATFDLIVFEEFSYRAFGLSPDLMLAIKKRVEQGGSLLLIGGEAIFTQGSDYDLPQVRDLVPLQFAPPGTRTRPVPFKFQPSSLTHPVTRLDPNTEQNRRIWDSMPPMVGIFPVQAVKPGALAIGKAHVDGRDLPVLAGWNVGRGRVAALATRTTWRWSLAEGKGSQSASSYQAFWKNMVMWLTRSREYKSVRLALDGRNLRFGETGTLRVWVYDEYFKPISDVDVRILVKGPEGEEQTLSLHQETDGVYVGFVPGDVLGEYEARAFVTRQGKRFGEDSTKFIVLESHFEEEDLRPDFALLKEMANSSGGRFITAPDFSPDLLKEFAKDSEKLPGRKVLLWNNPWVVGIVLLFLIGEWILRKRRGLP